jgi:hypothetical protein
LQIFRVVSRIRGDPIATIRIRPSFDYNSSEGYVTRGSHHIRYCGSHSTWRLTTNAPIQLVLDETPFLVHETVYLGFGQDESVSSDLAGLAKDYEDKTLRFWKNWTSNTLCLPVDYQEVLLRSAITVQLLQSEELGGLVHAFTCGIPLGPDVGPSRDERTIQLPELCLSIPVLRELGMHQLVKKLFMFLKLVVLQHQAPQAVYGYRGQISVPPLELASMAGYLGIGPALAGGVVQPLIKDVACIGLTIVGLCSAFFDVRTKDVCSPKLFSRLEELGTQAVQAFSEMLESKTGGPRLRTARGSSCDSREFFEDDLAFLSVVSDHPGNLRSRPLMGVHTLTAVLCWAAVDRLARVSEQNHWVEKSKRWALHAHSLKETILAHAVSPSRKVLVSFWGTDRVGPSLLRLPELGFIAPSDPLFVRTVEAFETDGLGVCLTRAPEWSHLTPSAPVLTSTLLWYIEALRSVGKISEARQLFHALCASANECGLLAQSVDLKDGTHWGNVGYLPTLLGVLRVGSRLSRSWRGV